MKGTIKSIQSKGTRAGDKTYYVVTLEGDPKEHICWDKKVLDLSGKEIEYTIEVKGKYENLILSGGKSETKSEFKAEYIKMGVKPDNLASFALSYSKDLCVAGKIEKDDVLLWASAFYEWLKNPVEKQPF